MNKRTVNKKVVLVVILTCLVVVLLLLSCLINALMSDPRQTSYRENLPSVVTSAPQNGHVGAVVTGPTFEQEMESVGRGKSSGPYGGDIAKIIQAIAAPLSLPGTSGQCQMPGDGFGPDVPYCS